MLFVNDSACSGSYDYDVSYLSMIQPVQVEFIRLSIACGGDYIKVYRSSDPDVRHLLVKVCGTITPPIFKSQEGEVLIQFTTDHLTEHSGFQFVWGPMGK